MGLYLIGMAWDMETLLGIRDTAIAVLEVAIGLGLVIFVHELGHFAVAKFCGVKCEKFYLGFDIGGLKLWRHRWGETEYGIGILPLGGYVKMLGQEDNPARLKEEIERAKVAAGADVAAATDVAKAEQALYDPRSYLAQSVPKRMAIISAGVIMNLIFAFVVAVVAYKIGVRQIAAGVGQIVPGYAAWQSNFKVGDEIVEIAGKKVRRFQDVLMSVSLDDMKDGLPVVVRRRGEPKPITLVVTPDSSGLLPRIGVANALSTTLAKKAPLTLFGSAAANAQPPFQPGDRIIAIDDRPIDDYEQIHALFAQHPDKTLQVTVERKDTPSDGDKRRAVAREVTIELPPNPMRDLGLVMEMGEISAIQKDSPAAAAGLQPGDYLRAIDHQPVGDPVTLPDRLRRRAGETVTLTIAPKGTNVVKDVQVTLRGVEGYTTALAEDTPVAIPELGLCCRVLNRVQTVLPDGPAADSGIQPGDEITSATILRPDAATLKKYKSSQSDVTLPFDDLHRNWPCLLAVLQDTLPESKVKLEWVRLEKRKQLKGQATLTPEVAKDWYDPARGLLMEPVFVFLAAETWGEAVAEGGRETLDSTLTVYRLLQNLGSRISWKALGGPITIFRAAKIAADEGIANLLLFLTLLSANLAVLNFLPIPLLDGGHMVFLAYEGITGKPANEHVQSMLAYIGLAFILALMIWVFGLDFGLIPRR